MSQTWIVEPFGDGVPKIHHESSEGEQWGRYNLPIYIFSIHTYVCIYSILFYGVVPFT